LNYHKIIHCGEGGLVVTDDDALANKLQLIRNHGEAVVKSKGDGHLRGLIGFNYRMTEIEAAIASEQLKKLPRLAALRIEAADFLRERWSRVPGLAPASVQPGCRHVYYALPVQVDAAVLGISRDRFVEAVRAEGIPVSNGYVEPLYLQPLYQSRRFLRGAEEVPYARGLCPVTEAMHFERLFSVGLLHAGLSRADLEDVATAIEKVAAGARELAGQPA